MMKPWWISANQIRKDIGYELKFTLERWKVLLRTVRTENTGTVGQQQIS